MKQILLSLTLIFISFFGLAQLPAASWGYIPLAKGTGNEPIHTIADMTVDKQGNILTLGSIAGISADMDPAPGAADTSYSEFGTNNYFSKTSATGKLIFIKYFKKSKGASFLTFFPRRILVDDNNDIIIAADFYGKADFNPTDADSANLISAQPTYPDMAIAKYNSSGQYLWAFNITSNTANSTNSLYAGIALTSNNDIVVNTQLTGTTDLDPSANVATANSGNKGCVVVSYSSAGAYKWHTVSPVTTSYGVVGYTCSTDANNNSYFISMGSYATTIYKVDATGTLAWNKTMGTGVYPFTNRTEIKGINAASNGDFVIYGSFINLMNFNITGGFDTIRSNTNMNNDFFIAKYSGTGSLLWKKTFSNTTLFGKCFVDAAGSFHCSGSIKNDLTMDGVTIKGGVGINGAFYAKWNASGTLVGASGLAVNSSYSGIIPYNNSYVAFGKLTGTADIDPGASTLNLTSAFNSSFTAFYGTANNGLNEGTKPLLLQAFPMPASNILNIAGPEFLFNKFDIYNLEGALILSGVIDKAQQIEVGSLASGTYLLQLHALGQPSSTTKLMISR